MSYWVWYLLIALLAWAFKYPWLAAIAIALFLARHHIPNPLTWIATVRTVREMRGRIAALPADLLTRRDLARVLLERGRAEEATALLEEAIAKGLHDAESFYLLGFARLRSSDPEGALEPIVRAVTANPKFLMGEPFLVAADALCRLEKYAEAEDSLDRALEVNSSRADVQVQLARVRTLRGDRAGAAKAYRAAVDTWRDLPDFLRWRQLPSYLAAKWSLWIGK